MVAMIEEREAANASQPCTRRRSSRRSHAGDGRIGDAAPSGSARRAPHFIILTTFDDADALLEGCKAGARVFLLKDVSLEQLASSIRSVADRRLIFQTAGGFSNRVIGEMLGLTDRGHREEPCLASASQGRCARPHQRRVEGNREPRDMAAGLASSGPEFQTVTMPGDRVRSEIAKTQMTEAP